MILTVLIGNTNTRLAWFAGRNLKRRTVFRTPAPAAASSLLSSRASFGSASHPLAGTALASVVPTLTRPVAAALYRLTGTRPFVLTARARTGLRFAYNRSQLGADRMCAAVGARHRYQGDLIVIDFGTAVTVNVISREGVFLGGLILPGIQAVLDAMTARTARLPRLRARTVRCALGHNTRDSMHAGAIHLLSGGINTIVENIEQETGRRFKVVATGGGAALLRSRIGRISAVDPDLASRGLAELLSLNR
jgi:type III pantothenate kinase